MRKATTKRKWRATRFRTGDRVEWTERVVRRGPHGAAWDYEVTHDGRVISCDGKTVCVATGALNESIEFVAAKKLRRIKERTAQHGK